MKINVTEIKVGMILEFKDNLWEVLKTNHVKTQKPCFSRGKYDEFCEATTPLSK